LQCDELFAEIEQRVTRLENVLTRYSSRYIWTGGPLVSALRHYAQVLFNICCMWQATCWRKLLGFVCNSSCSNKGGAELLTDKCSSQRH
jgi:hypothetical protein